MLKIADMVQWIGKDEWWMPNCPLVIGNWYRVTEIKNGPFGEYIKINGWYVFRNFIEVNPPNPWIWRRGDRVRIALEVMQEEGWDNNWSREMSAYIGMEFPILEIMQQGVYLKGGDGYGWPPSCLEPV